ncbi:hypothetical protein EXB32_13080 [Salmonella enterica subsp. enterica serovar Stanley]|nr:hypothetical protein [Salmonella enterica subsp. enterica serovar Stanley]
MNSNENTLNSSLVISTTNDNIMWLIDMRLSSKEDLDKFIMFVCNRNINNKYIVKASLSFIYESEEKLTSLGKLGLSALIITDAIINNIQISPILIRICKQFNVWIDVSTDRSKKTETLRVPKLFHGVCLGFDDDKIWDLIASKVLSQINTRIFVYGVSDHDSMIKLFNWVDYITHSN